jgi:hypothetical protein
LVVFDVEAPAQLLDDFGESGTSYENSGFQITSDGSSVSQAVGMPE